MLSAQLLTIGTEITSGEVVNTNASWLSLRLEEMGVRVFSHLSVRDHRDEILGALKSAAHPVIFVTGGLGPTSDDMTRDCLAIHTGVPLDFDNQVWGDLKSFYETRGLPLREAHRWQCHFPRGSERLKNSAGTALGFYQLFEGRHYFVLPGPPRELEAMWDDEVKARVAKLVTANDKEWVRWTCLGAPESEVAEKVEPVLSGQDIEVGYRAQLPYVKVKVYVGPAQKNIIDGIEAALAPWIVARGMDDIAEELLLSWPGAEVEVVDTLTGNYLVDRLLGARAILEKRGARVPAVKFRNFGKTEGADFCVGSRGEEIVITTSAGVTARSLPYKLPLYSERGRRSAAEWAIWTALCALRARDNQA